jgi:aryl-alcohol dehydrogenase
MNIKAAVVRGKSGLFVIEDIQLDEPRADEVIVRVVSVGICHTDLIPRDRPFPLHSPPCTGTKAPASSRKWGRRSRS